MDISSINTFGYREDNLYVPFSRSIKDFKKTIFTTIAKNFEARLHAT